MKTRWMLTCAAILSAALWQAGCENSPLSNVSGPHGDDGGWTILLCTLNNPQTHVKDALYYKERCEKNTGWKDLYVVHKADHSELYWGKYSSPEAARKNLAKAREYVAPAGYKVFDSAMLLPLAGKDYGPQEWNLAGAKGAYTVVVAVFYDMPKENYVGRKRFAVDYCRQLRQEQNLEAYYYHDPSRSAVSIGVFDGKAVEITHEGTQDKPVVVNPEMKRIMERFPLLAVNGREEILHMPDSATRKLVPVKSTSYVVRIPQKKGQQGADWPDRIGDAEPRQNP